MYELRDLLRSYQLPEVKSKKDLKLSESVLDCLQLDINYGIKSICRLADFASTNKAYSDKEARQDLGNIASLINSLIDVNHFVNEQRDEMNYKLEVMDKGGKHD